MTAYIVLNGEKTANIDKILADNADIYCADGGADYLYEYGLIPKIIIGDMDSIDPKVREFYKEKKCVFLLYPREKDETDGELIVDCALTDAPDEIVILCGTGGRVDHLMGNIQLLYKIAKNGIVGKMIGNDATLLMGNRTIKVSKEENQIISIIPYTDNTVLTLNGFKYNVNEFKFEKDTPIGLSNYLIYEEGEITVHEGCPLVIITKEDK